jgi:glutathione S-transferase
MGSQIKPLNLYGGGGGPNPWKVVILLEELKVPYETTVFPYTELKTPAYEKINPNGRLPALHDPNTGITIWESGAILEYVTEQYDKENKLSFPALSPDSYVAKQWLHYQVSGQGPYYGQATWFKVYHPENLPSAYNRYWNEIKRVTAVMNKQLEGKEYFVGNKFSFVDIAFFVWQNAVVKHLGEDYDYSKEAPNVQAWLDRLNARPSVIKAEADAAPYRRKPST